MTEERSHKLIIVGCGASGMMAGCIAGLYSDDVLILDANNVPGKKLLATGNGRCNFTNIFVREDRFNLPDYSPAMDIYKKFDFEDVLIFFERLGVPVRIKDNYCYPYNLEAVSIRDSLVGRLEELGVKIKLTNRIKSVSKDPDNGRFSLVTDSGYTYEADKVILACAGLAGSSFGCDGSVFDILKSLGATNITKPLPALVGLTSRSPYLHELAGVRAMAKVTLYVNGKTFKNESGEIIFSNTGISGIPIMDLSRHAARFLDEGQKCSVALDFFEELSGDDLEQMLKNMIFGRSVTAENAFTGILNHKLLNVVLRASHTAGVKCDSDDFKLSSFINLLKSFELDITGTAGFDNAQVTTGGLSLEETDPNTMEAKFCKGLYITGETLDVDGLCGGYNLQWAWSTGALAGACATAGTLDKTKLFTV